MILGIGKIVVRKIEWMKILGFTRAEQLAAIYLGLTMQLKVQKRDRKKLFQSVILM